MGEKTQIVKRYSLSRQVSDKIEEMINEGVYKIGQRIPTEPELMEMFQVSRNTIREAVQSLTWAGVLEVKQGDGTYVRSNNRFQANMNKKYSEVSLNDIAEARNCLEINFAYLAASRCDREDIEKISVALNNRKNCKDDIKENTKADIEFHMQIAKACHNSILIDLYNSISDYLEDHILERQLESDYDSNEIDAYHENLFLAIKRGDSEDAVVWAKNILKI